jgi:succinoglycan biosynthesis transport protein ExoP
MDFRTYATALRRYWWIAAITTLLGILGAGVTYAMTPPTYASRVTFYVSTPVQTGVSPQSANQFAEARVNSYVVLMSSERVARDVIARTGVTLTPAEVMSRISAEANLNTVVVQATISDSNQDRASELARGLAETFGETVSRLDNQGAGRATVIINVVSGPTDLGAVEPRLKVYAGLGVLVGVALIILRELLDSTVRSVEGASEIVGAPGIGNIGFDPGARRSPLLATERNSLRAEAFRQLRTNLTFVGVARPAQVLVVTSAMPGEGKTSLCLNLALALSETGHRVLVLEGDLRKPQMAELLGLESGIGLTNVLVGQVDLDEALQTWTPQVTVLTSGSLPPNPAELLEGDEIRRVLDDLRPRFDRILIDTTPLLPVTDAAVASALGDGVVMVVRHAKTTREQVAVAVRSLQAVNAEIVGVVLSMRRARRSERRSYSFKRPSTTPLGWTWVDREGPSAGEAETEGGSVRMRADANVIEGSATR